LNKTVAFFVALAAALAASRLCHSGILWEGDTLPLATAGQMLAGETIYREIWFDKPPLVAMFHLICAARPGWPLRVAGAAYAFLACWMAWRFARDLWTEREAMWAAGLMAFFLTFDFPSMVIPAASDMLLVAPHLAAVWMAATRRPLASGILAGVGFWVSPKALFVAAACVVWHPGGILRMAVGLTGVSAAAAAALWGAGALGSYWEQVWQWGRLYAGSTFITSPLTNGALRTINWMAFHAALVVGALCWRPSSRRIPWFAWLLLSFAGVAAGLRFFPRYYFLVLPVVVLMAARGFTLLGRKRVLIALLLLIPAIRFAPSYLAALTEPEWRDTAMDRDSRAAAALLRQTAAPGDTLFVWGYRPEIYTYTQLPAATMYLDCQPLTGVPADRHLTQSQPVETEAPARRRAELTRTSPTFIADGLGLFNPALAISTYPDLQPWFAQYREAARTGQTVIYRRIVN
jgi:hypothetical protein